jgi:hypothetical protein
MTLEKAQFEISLRSVGLANARVDRTLFARCNRAEDALNRVVIEQYGEGTDLRTLAKERPDDVLSDELQQLVQKYLKAYDDCRRTSQPIRNGPGDIQRIH